MGILAKYIYGNDPTVAVEVKAKDAPSVPVIQTQEPVSVFQLPKVEAPLAAYHAQPFSVRSIEHTVTFEGVQYLVCIFNIDWLYGGDMTFANVTIELSRYWSVTSRGQLGFTHGGRPRDVVNEMIGAFAQKGLMVSRHLIDACLFPVTNQILEIERQLKNCR